MSGTTELSQEETELIAKYNIKQETRTVFFSDGYKYDNLKDAVRYAKLSLERKKASAGN